MQVKESDTDREGAGEMQEKTTRSAATLDRYVGGCVGWIAAPDPGGRFVGGCVGYIAPGHSRYSGGPAGFITETVTADSHYVGGVVGYVNRPRPRA
jgi:hypothetical protein